MSAREERPAACACRPSGDDPWHDEDCPLARPEIDLREAVAAIANENECFGSCTAGRVRGAHLANHTPECARVQLALHWVDVPKEYRWDDEAQRLVHIENERARARVPW